MATWNDSMPGMTPSAQRDENPAEVLEAILGKNATDLNTLATKAATPIAGGHATGLPLSMDPTPKQNQPGQLDHREVVGAGNARAQGIGNSIIGVMNLVAGTKTAVDNKKRLEVASATQQLLTAQSAADQAKQILQSDPNNATAKEAVKHNTDIMNGILSNDKTRGAIAKGFNIDFANPDANKTPDHAAVQQGIDMAKKTASYAEQFSQKTPTVMAPNNVAIAQYQAAQQAQKDKLASVKAMMPYWTEQARSGATLDKAKMDNDIKLRTSVIDANAKLDEQILKNKQAQLDNQAARSLVILKGSIDKQVAAATQGSPEKTLDAFQKTSKDYLSALDDNQKQRTELNKQLDSESKDARKQEIRAQLKHLDDVDETAKESFLLGRNFAASQAHVSVDKLKVPTIHVGDSNGAGTGTNSTKSNSSPDINPITGKPFGRDVPATARILAKAVHGISEADIKLRRLYEEGTTPREEKDPNAGN